MANDDEVAIRLSLSGRARFIADAKAIAHEVGNLGKVSKNTGRDARGASTGISAFATGIKGLWSVTKVGVVAVGAIGAAAVAVGVKLYRAGSDAYETTLKYRQVFKELTPQVDRFIKTTNQNFGIPTKELQDATALFAIFAKSAGVAHDQLVPFSTSIVQASEDLASFHNVDVQVVFTAMKAGLSGMVRPLRQYGIFMSDAAIKQEAVAMGLVKAGGNALDAKVRLEALHIAAARYTKAVSEHGEKSIQAAQAQLAMDRAQNAIDKSTAGANVTLSEQQKILARQKFILDNIGDASGDLARTILSPQNQLRMLRNRLLELSRTLGGALLPGINTFVQLMNKGMKTGMQWLSDHASDWTYQLEAGLDQVRRGVIDAASAFRRGGWREAAKNIDETVGANGRFEDIIRRVHGVLIDLGHIWQNTVLPIAKDFRNIVVELLAPAVLGGLILAIHILGENSKALKVAIEAVVAIMVLNKAAVIGLNAVEAIGVIRKVAFALATSGLATAQTVAAASADAEAVSAGVLNAVLDSGLVRVLAFTGGLIVNAGIMLYDSVVTGIAATATWLWSTAQWAATVALNSNTLAIIIAIGKTIFYLGWLAALKVALFAQAAGTAVVTAAQWALNVALDANPIGLLVIAIALLIGGLVLAYKRIGWFRTAVDATGRFLKAVFMGVIHFVSHNWQLIVAILLGPITMAVYLIRQNWDRIRGAFSAVVGFIRWEWHAVLNVFSDSIGFVEHVFDSIWGGITNAFKVAINFVIDLWNRFVHNIPAIHISFAGQHFDLDLGQTLDVPRMHQGGTVNEGGLVNWRPGEEIIVLPPAASVIPLPTGPAIPPGTMASFMADRPIKIPVYLNGRQIAEAQYSETADRQARR